MRDTLYSDTVDVETTNGYRYAFNGMERDDEWNGVGNIMFTEYRVLDTRLSRWLSIDPMFSSFPWQSPYVSMDNNPIYFDDVQGLSVVDGWSNASPAEKHLAKLYPYSALIVLWNRVNVQDMARATASEGGYRDLSGGEDGQKDAINHSLWSAMNARDIGTHKAGLFTTAHELQPHYLDPESSQYDPLAIYMDLYNNSIGIQIGEANPDATDEELLGLLRGELSEGRLLVMKMEDFTVSKQDENGNSNLVTWQIPVDANGNPIVRVDRTEQIELLTNAGYTVNTDLTAKPLEWSNGEEFTGFPTGNTGQNNTTTGNNGTSSTTNADDKL